MITHTFCTDEIVVPLELMHAHAKPGSVYPTTFWDCVLLKKITERDSDAVTIWKNKNQEKNGFVFSPSTQNDSECMSYLVCGKPCGSQALEMLGHLQLKKQPPDWKI